MKAKDIKVGETYKVLYKDVELCLVEVLEVKYGPKYVGVKFSREVLITKERTAVYSEFDWYTKASFASDWDYFVPIDKHTFNAIFNSLEKFKNRALDMAKTVPETPKIFLSWKLAI